MHSLLQPASEFIARHHEWAAVVLGFATFLESLVLLGAFVPATALMLIAGGLMAKGVLDPVTVISACVIGAVAGDTISFMLGRRLGRAALRHPVLTRHRRAIARTRLLCQRFGSASVYAGRFFGPLRAFVPLVVGALGMRRRRFQVANVVSGVLWVLAMLAPGYFATRGLAELGMLSEADTLTLLLWGLVALLAVGAIAGTLALRAWRQRQTRIVPAALQAEAPPTP